MSERDAELTLAGFRRDAIAIIGMSCRFPGADDPQQFWANLVAGADSITRERVADANGGVVPARAMLDDVDQFDARFFRFTPKQADIADPQLRLALESAWLALDSANCSNVDPDRLVGVFMGASLSTYLLREVLPHYSSLTKVVGGSQILFTNDKDFYPTTISHRLDLKGPSLNVSTACSTGLVAVHGACQALATYQCDIALAGASSVLLPQEAPPYEQGGIYSRDGHCRAFDADAAGTVGGSGCGFVVLKRMEDALRDRDFIHAVILGGAVNNDGSQKVSFAAPSAAGQRAVIEQALANAGVEPASISMVEGHGTGTLLGDAVELEALTSVFADAAIPPGSCALGSVKTNVGHLDTAAGMAGLIKTALALQHGVIPPSLNFRKPDPKGALEGSAFHVPTSAARFPAGPHPRRAGVSAFGIGGTNAHLILQEAPVRQAGPAARPFHIVPVSAPSDAGHAENVRQLAGYLRDAQGVSVADVAFTLGVGRKAFDRRRAHVVQDVEGLCEVLNAGVGTAPAVAQCPERVAFVFPQPDADDFEVFKAAFEHEAAFRQAVRLVAGAASSLPSAPAIDLCAAFARATLPDRLQLRAAVLFAGQLAMARTWMGWGVRPQAVAGRGDGAWVAACVADIVSVPEAIEGVLVGASPRRLRAGHPDIAWLDAQDSLASAPHTADDPFALFFSAHAGDVGDVPATGRLLAWRRADGAESAARHFYEGVAAAWTCGLAVDWTAFHDQEPRLKLPILTLPFERTRHWLDSVRNEAPQVPAATALPEPAGHPAEKAEATLGPADWCYVPVWRRCLEPRPAPTRSAPRKWLLLTREDRFCAEFARRIRLAGDEVIEVFAGRDFKSVVAARGEMDPRDGQGYDALIAQLAARAALPDCIVHLWSLQDEPGDRPLSARLDDGLTDGLHALIFLAQALGRAGVTRQTRLTSLYAGVHDIGGERSLQPQRAALTAALKIIPHEYPNLSCQGVDLVLPLPGTAIEERLIDRLIVECENEPMDTVCAYRGDVRWVQAFEAVQAPAPTSLRPRLKQGGVYLVTGGCGGVGLALAGYLASHVQCSIALVSRSTFAPSERWQALASGVEAPDSEPMRIARELLALQARDCRVRLYQADVSDRAELARAVTAIESDFGEIRGVIHAAGVADTAGIIQTRTRAMTDGVLSAKVHGAINLDELLRGRSLDFFVLCSSIGSVLHALKFGEVGYVAANDFLDSFADYRRARERGLTLSINWTDWLHAGMSMRAKSRFAAREAGKMSPQPAPSHPLLGRRRLGPADEWIFENTLRAKGNWVLDGHRIGGVPVLPGTAYIEIAFAAFAACTGKTAAEIVDLILLSPLAVPDGEARELQVILSPTRGGHAVSIQARQAGRAETWAEHARAEIFPLAESGSDLQMRSFGGEIQPSDVQGLPRGEAGPLNDAMRFGGRWGAVERVAVSDGTGSAWLALPEQYRSDLDDYLLHPALLDCAVSFLIPALLQVNTDPYVPLHYQRVRIRRPGRFPAAAWAHSRSKKSGVSDGGALTLDAQLVDAFGAVWVDVSGMTVRKSGMTPAASPAVFHDAAEPRERASRNWLLDVDAIGRLDTLRFVPVVPTPMGPDDVEVRIQAAALNFKDVLVALGMVPPPSPKGKFGLEFAGVVTRLGSDVRSLEVGDEVMGFGGPWLAPNAVYPAAWLRRRPARLSLAEAAAAPVAFTIAQLALREIGGLRRGESVLIHSATGGVGLAAVQVAQEVGAEIHATAGSEAKRAFLRGLGVPNVYDSRSSTFRREILERTGAGVDAVLNSLGLELARASLDVLKPQGRFLELGLGNGELAPLAEMQGKHFLPVVVDTADPALERAWIRTTDQLASGRWTALPTMTFEIDRLAEAFDHMAAARHIGKIVVTYDGWERLGLADDALLGTRSEGDFFDGMLRGMSQREGIDVFDRVLHLDFSRVVVSTQPLPPLIERSRAVGRAGIGEYLSDLGLSAQARARPDLATALKAPDDHIQSRLVRIWSDLLGVHEIGIHDDFFDLGGDSLSAIRLLSRCREEFKVEQTLAGLLDFPTIGQLAKRIEELQQGASEAPGDGALRDNIVI